MIPTPPFNAATVWLAIGVLAIFGTASRIYIYRMVNGLIESVKFFTQHMPKIPELIAKADAGVEAADDVAVALRQLATVMNDRLTTLEEIPRPHLTVVPDVDESERDS